MGGGLQARNRGRGSGGTEGEAETQRLAEARHAKRCGQDPARLQTGCEGVGGGVDAFVGEPEGTEVHGDAVFRRKREVGLDRLVGVHVLLAHEPARLIGPDG